MASLVSIGDQATNIFQLTAFKSSNEFDFAGRG